MVAVGTVCKTCGEEKPLHASGECYECWRKHPTKQCSCGTLFEGKGTKCRKCSGREETIRPKTHTVSPSERQFESSEGVKSEHISEDLRLDEVSVDSRNSRTELKTPTPITIYTPTPTPTPTPPSGDGEAKRKAFFGMENIQEIIEEHKKLQIPLPPVELNKLPEAAYTDGEIAVRGYVAIMDDFCEQRGALISAGYREKPVLYAQDQIAARTGLPNWRVKNTLDKLVQWEILRYEGAASGTRNGRGCHQYLPAELKK